ncbi:hypothetical protein Dsin_031249 [Dipteronia sinensis]|uniref:non-specific serine/threonine protein kinase n=1 Tax=Dipteronia sinensis TaxID=43782 RepID=A0AAE0DS08_9ROSI|nr:hypothetical protein Dsin_031249 [Dipteronia sinensis]
MASTSSGFNFLCLFPIVSILISNVFFVQASVSITGNCSTRASYVYCLDSGLPSTWYNNNSVIMDGWQMRVFLLFQNDNNIDIYCGFFCNGTCNSYLFSVVAVASGGIHSLVWSANKDRPVKKNAMVELTGSGLLLRDSDGTQVWSSNTSLSSDNSIVGMNLNQSGNLILFNNESKIIWQSLAEKISVDPSPNPSAISPSSPPSISPPFPPSNLSPVESPVPPGNDRKKLVGIVAGSVAGGIFIIGVVTVLFIVKIRRSEVEEQEEDCIKLVPGMPVRFSYEELRVATNDFKERIGGGGFGTVYKGAVQNGMMIAVKRLDRLGQGMREFLAEVETIGSLHHFNLVRLIGFCVERSSRLLVYEYMCNGSLDKWIFIRDERPCLDWQTRKKIILDIAKGLAYLHEDCRHRIIHLDIKPQNILLDENFGAKVSDFGLSQLINRDESQVHATMRGTPGYIAPEWRKSKITVKVDIYSFGIVLLEVVSARRNLDSSRSESSCHLLKLLQTKAEEDRLLDIVENLEENVQDVSEEMIRMIKIGAWCLQDDPRKRPSMSTVVKMLEGVMEVDENIIYRFSQATLSDPVVHDPPSAPPQPSVLSNPR